MERETDLVQISGENDDSTLVRDRAERMSNENYSRRKKIYDEVKKQLWLAGPLIAVSVFQYCIQMISLMFVGHLGEQALSGASMATSFAAVTGFSLLLGMAAALGTLCGQSYGAKQYSMLGIHMQRAMLILVIVSIPLAIIWVNIKPILFLLGQDRDISKAAGEYACLMVSSLFAYGLLQCLVKFLQTQNIVLPMMICSGITALLHILICWVTVFKSGLGLKELPWRTQSPTGSMSSCWCCILSSHLLVLRLGHDFRGRPFKIFSRFFDLLFHQLLCLEMWSFHIMVLLSGLLPNPELQTSVLSICLNIASTVWMIPFGLSAAVSTRVSNELGAGNPEAARLAVCVVIVMTISEGLLVGSILIFIRNVWGYAYSNDVEVVKYVAALMPFIATSNFLDSLQCVLSGNARGCGWQKIGAYVDLGSYYLVGIPCAVSLAFVLNVGGKGLWLGIICALAVQVTSLRIISIRTNWEQEAKKATERVYDYAIPVKVES